MSVKGCACGRLVLQHVSAHRQRTAVQLQALAGVRVDEGFLRAPHSPTHIGHRTLRAQSPLTISDQYMVGSFQTRGF
eukprot:1518908-Prymnesium_polylepis.1